MMRTLHVKGTESTLKNPEAEAKNPGSIPVQKRVGPSDLILPTARAFGWAYKRYAGLLIYLSVLHKQTWL